MKIAVHFRKVKLCFILHLVGLRSPGRRYRTLTRPTAESKPAESKPSENKPAAGGTAAGETPFQKHASQAGVRTCAKVFAGLGQALTLGSTYTEQTQWNTSSPDTHPVQAVAGMVCDLPDYKAQAAGVVFASPIGQGCEGGFVRVAPFQKTCQEIMQTLPKGSVLADNLSNTMLFNLAGDGSSGPHRKRLRRHLRRENGRMRIDACGACLINLDLGARICRSAVASGPY